MRSATETRDERERARSSRVRRLVAGCAVALLAALGAVLAVVLPAVGYPERSPSYCAQCHSTQPQFALWSRSDHRSVACPLCHRESATEGLATLLRFSFSPGKPEKVHDPRVPREACTACHLGTGKERDVAGSAGHEVHVVRGQIDCMKCHARSIHEFRAAQDACRECHEQKLAGATRMEELHCVACHDFLARGTRLIPSATTCAECHRSHGLVTPRATNPGMAKLGCPDCHPPHKPAGSRAVARCASCHPNVGTYGLHGKEGHEDCTKCHDAHLWTVTERDCTACHASASQHAKGQLCWSCHSMTRPGKEAR